jgi:hypothetical protein
MPVPVTQKRHSRLHLLVSSTSINIGKAHVLDIDEKP